jgi:hypothetical protein
VPDRTPAETLTAAAETLREITTPLACRILLADPTLSVALADWLETAADYYRPGVTHPTHVVRALAAARALLGDPA